MQSPPPAPFHQGSIAPDDCVTWLYMHGACAIRRHVGMDVQDSFWDQIQTVRERELKILWNSFAVSAMFAFLFNFIPILVSVMTFLVYVLLGNPLTASQAFTSLSLFTVCPDPLASAGHQSCGCHCYACWCQHRDAVASLPRPPSFSSEQLV